MKTATPVPKASGQTLFRKPGEGFFNPTNTFFSRAGGNTIQRKPSETADETTKTLMQDSREGEFEPDPQVKQQQGGDQKERKTYTGNEIPKGAIDNPGYDTYFNADGTVNKVVSGGSGQAFVTSKEATVLLSLSNKDLLNRANWVFGESGGAFADRYASTIGNLRQSGKSGYGPTPFSSEEAMYKNTMSHKGKSGVITNLYPGYFNGTYPGANAHSFAVARSSYAALMADKNMVASIKAVLGSLTGKTVNEGYNNWRGSGDTLYTEDEKTLYLKNFKQPADQNLTQADTGKVYAIIKTHIDHYWEPVKNQIPPALIL